ncbi:MAG TPA: glycosyltransferase, partial [Polyangiaceae bacterium]|nr:glycosyltransferase [Polyangiaceae bacterium]
MALTQSPEISIIVPTYREAESLPALIERLAQLRKREGLDLEVLVVDDNSRDGTDQVLADLAEPWLELVVRTTDRGLSQAVLHGLGRARGQFLVVMDADLSHPPETIPNML